MTANNNNNYTITLLAQTKMALHAARHGMSSSPVHGVVLGKRQQSSKRSGTAVVDVNIVDVIPICHEVPTKPIVDMGLRLVESYLESSSMEEEEEGLRIVGWYTANPHVVAEGGGGGGGEGTIMPNVPALRIISSMAQCSSGSGGEEEEEEEMDLVLILVSTLALTDSILLSNEENEKKKDGALCTLFERDERTKTFTQKVDSSRVIAAAGGEGKVGGVNDNEILVKAMKQIQLSSSEFTHHQKQRQKQQGGGQLMIYDYIDHISNYGVDGPDGLKRRDWLENEEVGKFVNGV